MNGTEATSKPRPSAFGPGTFLIALLILLVLILGQASLPDTVGEQARLVLLQKLQAHYPHLVVSIGRGNYDEDVGLTFEDIEFRDPTHGVNGIPRLLVHIDQMQVEADWNWQKVAERTNPLVTRGIIIDGLEAHLWLDQNARCGLETLMPLPKFGPACPKTLVRDSLLLWEDPRGATSAIPINLRKAVLLQSTDVDGQLVTQFDVQADAHFLRQLNVTGVVDNGRFRVAASARHAQWNRRLLDRLPPSLSSEANEIRGLDCVADVSLRAEGGTDDIASIRYQADVTVADGQFQHPRIPLPLTQIRGRLSVTPAGIQIGSSQALFGDAVCRLDGHVDGLKWPAPAELNVTTDGLLMDDGLVSALPDQLKTLWQRLRPTGHLDVDAHLTHRFAPEPEAGIPKNANWTPLPQWRWISRADIQCKGIDVQYEKFPYPVQQLTGQIHVADDRAICESMHGRAGGRIFRCRFSVPTKPDRPFQFEAQTDLPLPIDEALLASLTHRGQPTSKLESFVRSLDPVGAVQVKKAIIRRDEAGIVHRDFELIVMDGRLNYQAFSYPLFNVQGGIRILDRDVRLTGFRGHSASGGLVRCHGGYRMPIRQDSGHPAADHQRPSVERMTGKRVTTDDPSGRLDLTFSASDVSIDDTLRSALPSSSQVTWDALAPGGVLDHLDVRVTRLGSDPIGLDVTARQKVAPEAHHRSVTLRPTALPYRLDVIGGQVHFDGQRITIEGLQASHGGSRLTASGSCQQVPDGRWQLSLDVNGGSRLVPDSDLIDALPDSMRQTMRSLQLRGPLGVRGKTDVLFPGGAFPSPVLRWDNKVQLEGNRIGDAGSVHSLRGELEISGQHDGVHLIARGNVNLDSMHVDDIQITGLRGPFVIRDDQMALGQNAASADPGPAGGQTARPIEGRLFGGQIRVNGLANLSASEFDVGLNIVKARVPTLLADLGHADHGLTGTLDGQMRLGGVLGDMERLHGFGQGKMEGANIYQLPFIIQIFNQLRISPSEDVAITSGDCKFTIDGRDVNFDTLRLWGDLVAFYGGGTVTRGRELDLSLDTRVSPQNIFTKAIGPLRDTPYTLWTLDVKGPIGSQTIQRRAFDNLGETMELLLNTGGSTGSPRTANQVPPPLRN
ncbi:hypothetical protein [Crateriforma conspicua]|uniref:AsmA-like C-terminal domain-containing protein n=1 Tax=Crateriforma conspicua TaxID=2527996 RepID=A0A5C6FS33_9PLAN|nr:hypothetical protein [Crateriforma conspicua]TWU65897.1 hypothetical protein V7x_14510 [Crateriforma conspicua]